VWRQNIGWLKNFIRQNFYFRFGRLEYWANPNTPHEAGLLKLSTDKAHAHLGWTPRWRGAITW